MTQVHFTLKSEEIQNFSSKPHKRDPSMKSPKTYKEAIEQSHREALYTVGAALLLFLFFWGVLLLTQDSAYSCWGLPLWFWLSCIGGYLLSVLVVWLLVKYFLRNFNLDHKEEKEP